MTALFAVVALSALAWVATVVLERGGRRGYGWVTGSEFVFTGLALGPQGLALIPRELLDGARPAVALGAAYLGLLFGLRFRPTAWGKARPLVRWASQLEALAALVLLRVLLGLANQAARLHLDDRAAWGLAAVGAATTKSAVAWVRSRHEARGPVTSALHALTWFDDLPTVAAFAVMFAVSRPSVPPLGDGPGAALAATGALGGLLGLLVLLLTGSARFREDIAWVALLGASALGAGLSQQLGLCSVPVLFCCGLTVALLSRHADALEALTEDTQRPAVQVLLLLGGAWAPVTQAAAVLGASFAALRIAVKLVAGWAVSPLVFPKGRSERWVGLGLFGAGGLAFACALLGMLELPPELGEPLLAGATAMAIVGDLVGAPALKLLLQRSGELPASLSTPPTGGGTTSTIAQAP